MFILHHILLLIDVYAFFSDVSLRRQAMTQAETQAEKFPFFFSRAMLICSIIWFG